jgi:mono/diheme cytochrome c family protein
VTGVAMLFLLPAGKASAAGDIEEGREVAETWCARCHVVGTARPYGGIDSTPTFFLMTEKLENYRQRVLTLTERRPHKALDLDGVSSGDLEDLAAYIGGLERP